MCGLWLSIAFDKVSKKVIETIYHRGPDHQELRYYGEGIYIGHARLSIIDVSDRANQPFEDETKSYIIVYNGEIYNYLELRKELEELGYSFRTSSDTEVLLNAYIQWGKDCLEKLNGMFAFVVYSKNEKKVFAARDRYGIKPLYIHKSGNKIAFASEIKQFMYLPGYSCVANRERVIDFITWRQCNHTEETLFEGVEQIRGGQYIEVSLRDDKKHKLVKGDWYSYERLKERRFQSSYIDTLEEVRSLLYDAVKIRLRADVEIATCLSGGIDSSIITCIIDQITDVEQNVFSCCNREKAFDEFEYAKKVIEKVKTREYHKIYFKGSFEEEIRKLTWHNDEPVASLSILAQENLFRSIKENGYKVAMSGQGADEVFGLYGRNSVYLNDLKRNQKYLRLFQEILWLSKTTKRPRIARGLWRLGLNIESLINEEHHKEENLDIYRDGYVTENPQKILAREMGLNTSSSARDNNTFLIKSSSLPMLLQYDDRTSMSQSVEERVPYLDYRFVELMTSVPTDIKIKNGDSKYLIKEANRNILPIEIYRRRSKLGFATPQNKWMAGENRSRLLSKVNDVVRKYKIFDQRKVEGIVGKKSERYYSLLWRVILMDIWAEEFNVKID